MDVITTATAARRLGVSTRQAQRLASEGVLTRAAGNVVTTESLARALAQRSANAHVTRAWSESTAWAALALLSGCDDLARDIGQAQLSRLRARLREATPESLAYSLRDRAQVRRFEGHSSAVERARKLVIEPRLDTYRSGLTHRASDVVDGYVEPDAAAAMTAALALQPAVGAANVVLRLTHYPHVAEVACGGNALAAADLAESTDPRERSEGLRLLADALQRHAR
jgi:hypothetical protein